MLTTVVIQSLSLGRNVYHNMNNEDRYI